jgi:uncharacterized protein YehS (DUF1456 family)
MTNNDILRSVRYLLNVRDAKLVEITALAGLDLDEREVDAYLREEEDPAYYPCPDEVMGHFLNGLVIYKRGKDESRPPQPVEPRITNNVVLKKIRVAFQLKDTDIIKLIEKSGNLTASKTELTAFFRNPSHRNYRECGDQFLRNVLRALSQ